MTHQDLAERTLHAKTYGSAMAAAIKTPALGLGNRLFHLRPSFGDRGIFSPIDRAVKASPEITAAHAGAALVAGGILVQIAQITVQVEQLVGNEMEHRLFTLDAADNTEDL